MKKLKNIKLIILFLVTGYFMNAQCVANFTLTVGPNGVANFMSTSPTSTNCMYNWDFGDGTSSGYSQNPAASHTYSYNQVFGVTLWIVDSVPSAPCFTNVTQNISISNASCSGNLSFSYYVGANGGVSFNNTSTGISSAANYTFAFGDGSTLNMWPANSHTYATAGAYNVTVTASGAGCTYSTVQTINVAINTCSIFANYTYSIGTGGSVFFNSTTTGTVNNPFYYWNFGDGNSGFGPNVSHTYFNNGIYNVQLTVTDSLQTSCMDTITQSVNLNSSCFANVNFWMWKDSTQLPAITWNAYTNYPANIVSATWNWGDGSSTTGLYPSHTYSAAGMYSICVTVSVTCGATAQACYNTSIWKTSSNANNTMATVNVKSDPTGIKIQEADLVKMSLYPNPNAGEFEINFAGISDQSSLKIYNVLGQEVYSETLNNDSSKRKVNISHLNDGTYFVKLVSGNVSKNAKLIISK